MTTIDPELSRAVLDALPDAVYVIAPSSGELFPLNKAAEGLAAGDAHPLLVRTAFPDAKLTDLCEPHDKWTVTRFASQGRAPKEVAIQLRMLGPQSQARSLLVVRMLGPRCAAHQGEGDQFSAAYYDPLTKLPNRRLFEHRLQEAIDRGGETHRFAVLFVDFDQFKSINDRFGHLFGDRLLIAAADRLLHSVRPNDLVARRDGDEFTILLDDLENADDVVAIAERIVEQLQRPHTMELNGAKSEIVVTASIGIVHSDDMPLVADDLIAGADAAMYRAKALGGDTYCFANHTPRGESISRKPLPR